MRHAKFALALFVLLAVNFMTAQKLQEGASGALHNAPDGKGGQGQDVLAAAPSGGSVIQGNGIIFHTGGTVLKTATVPVYIIWYGNWSNGTRPSDSQTTVNLIDAFFASSGGIGGSNYERINTLYGDLLGNVTGNLALSSQIFDSYSQTARLSDAKLQTLVSSHLTNGSLPTDPNGVYVVLTSSDVSESSGFCTRYCGFHTHATLNGADIKYAFVGNVDRCPSGCEIQTTSPNGDSGADGMANTLAHETEETITDPDLNAWFDASGNEDADKCNFKFGPTQTASNGSKFNQTFGTHNWMIQMEWENSRGGGCDQTLGGPFFTN